MSNISPRSGPVMLFFCSWHIMPLGESRSEDCYTESFALWFSLPSITIVQNSDCKTTPTAPILWLISTLSSPHSWTRPQDTALKFFTWGKVLFPTWECTIDNPAENHGLRFGDTDPSPNYCTLKCGPMQGELKVVRYCHQDHIIRNSSDAIISCPSQHGLKILSMNDKEWPAKLNPGNFLLSIQHSLPSQLGWFPAFPSWYLF